MKDYIRLRANGAVVGQSQNGSIADLNCGNAAFGYNHIKVRHEADWGYYSGLVSRNWRDMAGWSISWALYDPDRIYYKKSNSTWCYSRTVYLQQKQSGGGYAEVARTTPKVILGRTGVRIITSFPTNSGCTSSDGVRVR